MEQPFVFVGVDEALARFVETLKWSEHATEDEKTLVIGNLNGFASYLKKLSLEQAEKDKKAHESWCHVVDTECNCGAERG